MKCVGSLINCSRLNCRHNLCIFLYEVSFKVSKLKSPVSKIFCMLVSKARLTESSIDDRTAFGEFGGL